MEHDISLSTLLRRVRVRAMMRATTAIAALAAANVCDLAAGVVLQRASSLGAPYWQQLENVKDVQYFGRVRVGGQEITGLFDTGSFELLVFGEKCDTCGPARVYKHSNSSTYVLGNHTETHTFGSGWTKCVDAYEDVAIGPFTAKHAPFWEVVEAGMPVLNNAGFHAIIGIGPPGEPTKNAEDALTQIAQKKTQCMEVYGYIPNDVLDIEKQWQGKLEVARGKQSLLETFGISVFSSCLGKAPGSPGWLIWNDLVPSSRPEPFVSLQVQGNVTWSLVVDSLALVSKDGSHNVIGCQDGCGAIVDTGTSLVAAHTDIFNTVYKALRKLRRGCADLTALPDLAMNVKGTEVRFPPEAYIGLSTGKVSADMKRFFHSTPDLGEGDVERDAHVVQLSAEGGRNSNSTAWRRRPKCQLLMLDLGAEMTTLGPLLILGMPFFRHYYTSFTQTQSGRSIAIAPADDQCRPSANGAAHAAFQKRRRTPLRVDLGALKGPTMPSRVGDVLMI